MIEIHSMIIVVRAVFYENNKYYPQVLLDECLCKLTIKLMFLKELVLRKQVHQKSVIFVTTGIF